MTEAPANNWAKPGDRYVLAVELAEEVFRRARVTGFRKLYDVDFDALDVVICAHPLKALGGYDFPVPLLQGEHVTDQEGTGFVHTAPGHGREDFEVWMSQGNLLRGLGIESPIRAIPYTVDENGAFTEQAPGFTGKRVLTDKGEKGDANEAVIEALKKCDMLIARRPHPHQYPHSWRSKKPVIFRNTPQWFIAMDQAQISALLDLFLRTKMGRNLSMRTPGILFVIAPSMRSRSPAGCRRRARTAFAE